MKVAVDPQGRSRVGDARPSQMVYVYGVGAQVDLPNFSVVVAGLDAWDAPREPIDEPRLLKAVQRELGEQIEQLAAFPWLPGDDRPTSESMRVGVPVVPFPRWMRCPLCETLATIDAGIFVFKPELYRPERSRFVHEQCRGANGRAPKKPPVAVPARFVIACALGHLDEFPYHEYVHDFEPCSRADLGGDLRMYDRGSGTRSTDVVVACGKCDKKKSIGISFGEESTAEGRFVRCRGRRPELRRFDTDCKALPRPMLLGASNLWFSLSRSAFSLPRDEAGVLAAAVAERWPDLQDVDSPGTLAFALKRIASLNALRDFPEADVYTAIEAHRVANGAADDDEDLRRPEWSRFSDPAAAKRTNEFDIVSAGVPRAYAAAIADVVAARRLREVVALVGFARIERPELDAETTADDPARMDLAASRPRWVPAIDVRGEGIFIRFTESVLAAWAARAEGSEHVATLRAAHHAQRPTPWPGARYLLLHSFAHLLINEVALDCGYSAAAIRERIYAADATGEESTMAGVLLYTASPDAEGTLGGLVSLAEPARLGSIVESALERAELCGSDPLCADHLPEPGHTTLHGSACHACLFLPETSCERANRYLDRTVLVETLTRSGIA